MRHIALPLLLLIIIISFCLFSAIWVTNTVNQTELYLNNAVAFYNQQENALTLCYLNLASDFWSNRELFFGLVLEHEEVDEISNSFARLQSYALSEDRDYFLSNCAVLQASLSHLREMEWPYIENIL